MEEDGEKKKKKRRNAAWLCVHVSLCIYILATLCTKIFTTSRNM